MQHTEIKTYEDACIALNIDPANLPDVSMLPADEQKAITAHTKLVIIAKALNGDWKPNWNDEDEYKYMPYFDMENGFSFGGWYYDCQFSDVSSRLCFKSSELAEYAGRQFETLYKEYFVKE